MKQLLVHLPAPKTHLVYCHQIEDILDINLIKADTALNLIQRAKKQWSVSFLLDTLSPLLAKKDLVGRKLRCNCESKNTY